MHRVRIEMTLTWNGSSPDDFLTAYWKGWLPWLPSNGDMLDFTPEGDGPFLAVQIIETRWYALCSGVFYLEGLVQCHDRAEAEKQRAAFLAAHGWTARQE